MIIVTNVGVWQTQTIDMLLVMAIPRARGAKNTSISCALYFWTLGTLVNKFLVNCNKLLGKTKKFQKL